MTPPTSKSLHPTNPGYKNKFVVSAWFDSDRFYVDFIRLVTILELHGLAKLVPHGHPIDGGALHGGLRHAPFYHVIAHLSQFRCQHSVGFLKNNGLVMPHNTKINTIFVDIKAGDYSVPVHIYVIKIFLQISKIVTMSTQERTGNKAPALFFYPAGVEISRFLSIFAY